MDETRKQHLDISVSVLRNLYTRYKQRGLLSIYLWGSILREEYIPEVSDVDAIGIIDDKFPLGGDKNINFFLKEKAPELYDFRMNLVRLSELNGAELKTHLAVVTTPPVIMLLFPEWKYVCGEKYNRSDFSVKTPTFEQAICLSVKVLNDFYIPSIKKSDFSKFKSFAKRIMHICNFIHQIEFGSHPFSYKILRGSTSKQTQEVLRTLFSIKESDYKAPTNAQVQTMLTFVSSVASRYCNIESVS